MDTNTHKAKKIPVFKKGTCACESVGRTISGVNLNQRKMIGTSRVSNFYKRSESIKSRFLR